MQVAIETDKMTKLKTLKDLIEPSTGKGYSTTDTIRKIQLQFADGLKQEAVKWIKELELGRITLKNEFPDTDERFEKYHLDKSKVKPIIFILKYIFNITEEDLK